MNDKERDAAFEEYVARPQFASLMSETCELYGIRESSLKILLSMAFEGGAFAEEIKNMNDQHAEALKAIDAEIEQTLAILEGLSS